MRLSSFTFILSISMLLAELPAESQESKLIPSAAGLQSIKLSDIKKDMFEMASDHFRGRESGTLDEMKVSVWLAEKLRAVGLKPAGDDGTYFQFFSLQRNRISPSSSVKIGSRSLELWKDVLIAQVAPAAFTAPILYLGKPTAQELANADVKGKAVAILASPDSLNLNVSLKERRYPTLVLNKYRADLIKRGAAALIFIADEVGEESWKQVLPAMTRGLYDIKGGVNENVTSKPPVLWLHTTDVDLVRNNGATLTVSINIEHFEYPDVNVVGTIAGTDPVLSKEYVLFSGHQDHDGVRLPYGTDSIYNGADDNASTSVALLAIARAFKKQPGKRSAIFVWHGAEERGLLGSRWFSANPTIPKESIVAVLNADMIGMNNADSAALLGSQSPHKNSSELVNYALQANAEGPKFKLDTTWDKPNHIEGWYFRSDHLSYARAGIPAVFYSTLLHSIYHTPMDESVKINYEKLHRMTEWIYRTGWKVANAATRPLLDKGFKLER